MDTYQLGFTSRNDSLTLGTQHTFFRRGLHPISRTSSPPATKNAKQVSIPETVTEGEEHETDTKSGTKRSQAPESPETPVEVKRAKEDLQQEHPQGKESTGSQVAAASPEGTVHPDPKRDEGTGVSDGKQSGDAESKTDEIDGGGKVQQSPGSSGTGSGPSSPDRTGSTKGGDGPAPVDDAKQV